MRQGVDNALELAGRAEDYQIEHSDGENGDERRASHASGGDREHLGVNLDDAVRDKWLRWS